MSKMLPLLFLSLSVTSVASCKFALPGSDTKSSFAIDAGQDGALRDGDAPTFIMLSDWFQKFKVDSASKENAKDKVGTSALVQQIPQAYHGAIVAYLDSQIERNERLQDLIKAKKSKKVFALLKLEVDEMYDITGSLLNPKHKRITKDLFAKFIKLAWRDDFVDLFAEDFTSKVLGKRLLFEVLANLEKERENFKALLIAKYEKEGFAVLSKDLEKHLRSLLAMRGILKGEFQLVQTDFELTGIPAAFSSFNNQYFQEADRRQYGAGAAKPSFLSGKKEAKIAGNAVEKVAVANGGYIPGGGDGGFAPLPPYDPYNPYPQDNNGGIVYFPETLPSDPSVLNQNMNSNVPFQQHLPTNWYDPSFQTSAPEYGSSLALAPNHDCRKMNLTGSALIVCQRYFAYTGLQRSPVNFPLQDGDVKEPSGQPSSTTTPAPAAPAAPGAGSNIKLIEEGASRVVNQGSVPSCTAAAMAGTLESLGKMRGKNVSLDHEILWNAQGQRPMMSAAQEAARTAWASQGVTLTKAERIKDLAQIVDAINSGLPVHLGIDLSPAWTQNGGGAEFQLTAASAPTYGCVAGSGQGHAISVQGYIQENGKTFLIIKNSWGDSWGDNGFALVDPVSCLPTADGAIVDANFQ